MKSFILTVSLFVCLTLGVSNAQPLPDCLDKFSGKSFNSWNNCTHSVSEEGYVWSFIFKNGETVFGYMDYDNGKYTGDVNKNQERHGNGSFVFSNGSTYSGNWKHDKRDGQGTLKFASGSKYVGESKENNFDGQGTHTFTDGSKWVGTFKNNYLNGFATIYNADGSIEYEGIFKDSELMFAQNKSKTDSFKIFCEDLGFKPKTEGFGNCILKLMELNKD